MLDSLVRVSRRVLKVPKAIASPIGHKKRGLSENIVANSHQRSDAALGPRADARGALATSRTLLKTSGLRPYVYRRASRPEQAGPSVRNETTRTGSTASRRPTPDGSRRPTRRKVHAFAVGSKNGGRETRSEERVPSLDPAPRLRRNANEFLPSTFRVSQVYP